MEQLLFVRLRYVLRFQFRVPCSPMLPGRVLSEAPRGAVFVRLIFFHSAWWCFGAWMSLYIARIMYGGLGSKLFTHIHVHVQFLYRLINLVMHTPSHVLYTPIGVCARCGTAVKTITKYFKKEMLPLNHHAVVRDSLTLAVCTAVTGEPKWRFVFAV
jgi:hypothetical protein